MGPSLRLALLTAGVGADLSIAGVKHVWQHFDRPGRATRRLAELERLKLVATTRRPGTLDRVVRLTEAGRLAALGGRDPVQQWSRSWDGRWRVVLFDVPEREEALRARLRRKLRELHFGHLQNSAWISPDGTEVLRSTLAGRAPDVESLTILLAEPGAGESDQDLVAGAWDFDRLRLMYSTYLDLLRAHPGGGSLHLPGREEAWRRWLQREWHAWQSVMRHDPLLPEKLLPRGYLGRRVWEERQRVLQKLPLSLPADGA